MKQKVMNPISLKYEDIAHIWEYFSHDDGRPLL